MARLVSVAAPQPQEVCMHVPPLLHSSGWQQLQCHMEAPVRWHNTCLRVQNIFLALGSGNPHYDSVPCPLFSEAIDSFHLVKGPALDCAPQCSCTVVE